MLKLVPVLLMSILVHTATKVEASPKDEAIPEIGVCRAVTNCGGYYVSCITYGAACTWFVQPGLYVECTGYDAYGRYVEFHFDC